MKHGVRYETCDFGERSGIGPRDEEALTARHDGLGDARDLSRCLALAIDDFGKPLAFGTIVVQARKSEILDRVAGHRLARLIGCLDCRQPPLSDGLEQSAKARRKGRIVKLLIRQGFRFDSDRKTSLELHVVFPPACLIL